MVERKLPARAEGHSWVLTLALCNIAGGTLKKQLGEPTMMPNWEADAAAGKLILERSGLEVFHSVLHLEGGSIHTDGEGYATLLALPATLLLTV